MSFVSWIWLVPRSLVSPADYQQGDAVRIMYVPFFCVAGTI